MRHRPFPSEEDLASLDEEALKAAAEAADAKDEEQDVGWLGEIQLSKIFSHINLLRAARLT